MNAAPVVIKVGGSLAGSAGLRELLGVITGLDGDDSPRVIVPGGGIFADAVRAAQTADGFDDDAAHDMALLAMAQYGRLLAALAPDVHLAWGAEAVAAALAQDPDRPVIWQPDPRRDAPDIERSWRVTSDSLALWLARRLGARQLVLVKSCPIPEPATLSRLASAGVVDAALPSLAAAGPAVPIALVDGRRPAYLRFCPASAISSTM